MSKDMMLGVLVATAVWVTIAAAFAAQYNP
jgi:hypothetical protein